MLKFLSHHAADLQRIATIGEAIVQSSALPEDRKHEIAEAAKGLAQSGANVAAYVGQAKAVAPTKDEIGTVAASLAISVIGALSTAAIRRLAKVSEPK